MEPQDDIYEDDLEMEEESEEIFADDDGSKNSCSTNKWDCIISSLQSVLLNDTLEQTRSNFCKQHCNEFEDSPENKLAYTELFEAYCALLEGTINSALTQAVQNFNMAEFADMLETHQDQLDAEVFDLLLSMSEFDAFKELMLDTKRAMQDGQSQDLLLSGLTCCAVPLHRDEQEHGEERPDSDMSLEISPLSSPTQASAGAAGPGRRDQSSGAARVAADSSKALEQSGPLPRAAIAR